MKFLIILAVIFFAYQFFTDKKTDFSTEVNKLYNDSPISKKSTPTQNFKCDGRQHCSQMSSKAEAEFFLKNCPNTKMDGDHDGIPCEQQFP